MRPGPRACRVGPRRPRGRLVLCDWFLPSSTLLALRSGECYILIRVLEADTPNGQYRLVPRRMASADKDAMSSRYDGKPFLRLLDSFVLDAIGLLTDAQKEGLATVQPRLAQLYGVDGTWQQIVAAQLSLPESFREDVSRVWSNYLASAKAQGLSVDPNEFVERFVGENFPDIFA